MKKLEFKSIDFNKAINYDKSENQFRDPTAHYLSVANAVSIAQAKHDAFMKELIESWPVVRGYKSASDGMMYWHEHLMNDTHKARLAFIEEIVKEPCKHEPEMFEIQQGFKGGLWNKPMEILSQQNGKLIGNKCRHCGVELQATWTEKK